MQIRATISPSELREAARMTRSRYFWLRFFAANWYSTTICLLILGVAINSLIQGEHPRWGSMSIILAICSFFIWLSWYRWNTSFSKTASVMNAGSGALSLESSGIKLELVSGASTFIPWSSYEKWQEGKSVFVLTGKDGPTLIPIDDSFRQTIRSLLLSKIG